MDNVILNLGITPFHLVIILAALVIIILLARNAMKPSVSKQAEPIGVAQIEPETLVTDETGDDALIAVITAAIAAMMEDKASTTGFVVKRVRRVHNASAWQMAGREEQIYSRT